MVAGSELWCFAYSALEIWARNKVLKIVNYMYCSKDMNEFKFFKRINVTNRILKMDYTYRKQVLKMHQALLNVLNLENLTKAKKRRYICTRVVSYLVLNKSGRCNYYSKIKNIMHFHFFRSKLGCNCVLL